MQNPPIRLSRMEEGVTVGNLGKAYGDPEVLNSQGLGHSLVLFWTRSELKFNNQERGYYECTIVPNEYYIIGCDEDQRRLLLLYRSKFVGSPIRLYLSDTPKGVIERVFKTNTPEMSPNILHYSEDEYPHRDFALNCGIRSSFCFPFFAFPKSGIMEIVSTCDQDVVTLKKFCLSFEGFYWSLSFPNPNIANVEHYAIKEIDHFLEVVCQTFQLPLTQCWHYLDGEAFPILINQFSHRDFENLAPWCHFKDACFHTRSDWDNLGRSSENSASFCRNMKELSITQYPFAHYAQNCGSISCFTISLRSINELDEEWALNELDEDEDEDEEWALNELDEDWTLEFFLPAQKMDNYYPPTLLTSIWAKMKECLPNCKLASGEQLGQVLSVKVINSSARNEPEFFKLGQHASSFPHHEGSEYTPTLNLFKNGTEHSSNSNSYEEAATGKTSKRLPHQVDMLEEESHIEHTEPHSLVCQPKRPADISEYEGNTVEIDHSASGMTLEEPSKLKNHTVTAERVENVVEVSSDEGIEYAATPESKRLKKSKIPFTKENISKQFGRPLKDAAESFGVSVSTFKRRCRDVGISWWQPRKSKIVDGEPGERPVSGMSNLPNRPVVVCHENQDLNSMTVKVAYNTENIRFPLPSSSGFAELENNVIERLPLDRKSFSLKYQDDEGDWVLIACDKDVQECMKLSRSLKRTTIKMLLGPPINNQAP